VSTAEFRDLALALAGTSEAPHFDRTAFRAVRIFATLGADGLSANLKLAPEEQEFKSMLAPEAFAPVPGGWGRQGWTTVTLARIDRTELADALALAYAHAHRKRPRSPSR